ncbi:MAG: HAD family phosphatase [Bryobacterales bacterium]|nr:HAD family phosphatase [Bryobacterales bacterium]
MTKRPNSAGAGEPGTGEPLQPTREAPPISAVLFDFDGTLTDSEWLHHESWLEAVAPWGVTVSWDDYERLLVGLSDTRAAEFFLDLAGAERRPETIHEGRARKHAAYRRRSVRELSIDPLVKAWIERHWQTTPLGVVSSSAVPDVVPILERQGVSAYMRFVICGEHVARLKPDPMPYKLAMEKLAVGWGIHDPRECLVFEDSETGLRAARGAGMTVEQVSSPRDLLGLLMRWTPRVRSTLG